MSTPTLTTPTTPGLPSGHLVPSHPKAEPEPAAARTGGARRLLVPAALVLLLGLFGARCAWIAATDAITSDEATHLIHCLHYWMTGDDLGMWELGAPRLPHTMNALMSYAALGPARMLPGGEGEGLVREIRSLVLSGSDRVLVPARLVSIVWGQALLLAVFWAVARTGRPVLGLVAAALVALTPEVVAHASIAGSDMPFTTAAFLALILMVRYAERPTLGRWVALALGVGLAWAMRHTGIILLGAAGVVHLIVQYRRMRPKTVAEAADWAFGSVLAGAGLGAVALLMLWAGDGFELLTIREVADRVTIARVPQSLGPVDISWVPVPSSLLSLVKQIRHQNAGHEAYFLGEFGTTGWPLYFPVAFLLKTPLGLLALMVLAVARVRPRGAWDLVALCFLTLLWVMLVRNKVNIGVRYALLTYPLAATFMARMFAPAMLRDRVWGPVTLVAVAAFAWASLSSGTRCLSYFNEVGGGPRLGWLYLADSNIDWGQDFDALDRTVRALGITEVTTDVSSERRLSIPGVLTVANPGKAMQVPALTPPNRRLYDSEGGYIPVHTRYVAVSVSRLLGLYSQNDMSWLRTRRLVARIGDSTFLFDMDQPAEAPLFE